MWGFLVVVSSHSHHTGLAVRHNIPADLDFLSSRFWNNPTLSGALYPRSRASLHRAAHCHAFMMFSKTRNSGLHLSFLKSINKKVLDEISCSRSDFLSFVCFSLLARVLIMIIEDGRVHMNRARISCIYEELSKIHFNPLLTLCFFISLFKDWKDQFFIKLEVSETW